MDIRDRAGLKRQASALLQTASYDPKKLILIHTGVTVGSSVLISALSLLLSQGIDSTGGLSGIGTRNLLETIQSVLQLASTVLLPFWQIGILFAFLQVVRSQNATPNGLTRGFSRFGPVLRLRILEFCLCLLAAIFCGYLSSSCAIFFSPKLYELLEPMALAMMEDPNADPNALLAQIPPAELLSAMTPMIIMILVCYALVVIPAAYRLRLVNYLILDDPKMGAIAAMLHSLRLTKSQCIAYVKLDLSFLPYYLLQILALGLCYLDLILSSMGITLPIEPQWASFAAYGLYALVILATEYFMGSKVQATYALAYDALRNPTVTE